MKRLLLVLAMVCLASGAFAVDVSLGIGGSISYYKNDTKANYFGTDLESTLTRTPWNFMAYADMTYLQFAVGYRTFHGAHETDTGSPDTDLDQFSANYISFSAYGKIPFPLGSITIFPMVGVEYDSTLSGTFSDGTEWDSQTKSDQSEFWIKGGVGLDISMSPQVYLRPEFLVGYKLLNKPEQDGENALKSAGYTNVSILDLSFEVSILIGVRL